MPSFYGCPSNPSLNGTLSGNGFQATDFTVLRNATDWANTASIFQRNFSTRIADVTDGLSNTCLVYESAGRSNWYAKGYKDPANTVYSHNYGKTLGAWPSNSNAGWMFPCTVDIDRSTNTMASVLWVGNEIFNVSNWFGAAPYSFHAGGINMTMGDGSVRFVSDYIPESTVRALTSMNGREPTGEF